jgi:uncharacterized protein YoxC
MDNTESSQSGTQQVNERRTSAQTLTLDNDCMVRLADTFENSAKRWELIVYPSMIAFIVLAIYGFYLIYTLSRDVHNLSLTVIAMTESVDRNLTHMSTSVSTMDHTMTKLNNNIGRMSTNVETMTVNLATMTYNTNSMAGSTHRMQRDISNISSPMGFMSGFFP